MNAPILSYRSVTETGFLISLVSILIGAALAVANRYAATTLAVSPWALTFWQMLAGGAVLMLLTGTPKRSLNTLKHAMTWGVGLLRTLQVLAFVWALHHLTATEATFMLNLNIPLSLLFAWLFMKRPLPKGERSGFVIVCFGLVALFASQDGVIGSGILAVTLASLCWTLEGFLIETHPHFKRAGTFRERACGTGAALVATSTVFLLAGVLIGSYSQTQPDATQSILANSFMPTRDGLLSTVGILSGVLIGIFLRGPRTYGEYRAIRLAKTEYYMISIALLPFVMLMMESLLSIFGLVKTNNLSATDIVFGAVTTAGAMLMVLARVRNEYRKKAEENILEPGAKPIP